MSSNNNSSSSSGLGFLGALTIVFITLKLTHFIDWSWWWVISPIWIPILLFILGIAIWYFVPGWIDTYKYNKKRKKQKELDEKMR